MRTLCSYCERNEVVGSFRKYCSVECAGFAARVLASSRLARSTADSVGPKQCLQCNQLLERSSFHNDKRRADGKYPYCKVCRRQRMGAKPRAKAKYSSKAEYDKALRARQRLDADASYRSWRSKWLWSAYRMTIDEYEQLLNQQGGRCAICDSDAESSWNRKGKDLAGRALAVDHDHSCCQGNKSCGSCIRGLLCSRCNTAIGLMNDDANLLRGALEYLDKARSSPLTLSLFDIA